MQAGNDETDRPQFCGDTVGIQSKDDRILAPPVRMHESMAALDVVSQTYAVCRCQFVWSWQDYGLQVWRLLKES